ncbi:hypothetical protein SLEP1_g57293 [Rubroshorea leprosula]|uniref:Uncharacterized protein n=1 Tax=Rubroshorea leprosula TaxID=152421 RepID=A0AAV5ML07_9ROSI|nr:hypothetical protein SLEP1_g57293 [Rubroshorea leprosula]
MAELLYVLWRRRRFRRRSVSAGGDSEMSGAQFDTPSKELLYFFCWKNQSRLEPAGVPPVLSDVARDTEAPVDDDVEKWQAPYGPSRLLYTIKEEEKERAEGSEYSVESEAKSSSRTVSLRDALAARVLSEAALAAATLAAVADEVEMEVQPVTPYYTPSPSPSREGTLISGESGGSSEEEMETETNFLSIRVEE